MESSEPVDKNRFMRQLDLAYHPFNNDRAAIHDGVGIWNIASLGSIFYGTVGTVQAGHSRFP